MPRKPQYEIIKSEMGLFGEKIITLKVYHKTMRIESMTCTGVAGGYITVSTAIFKISDKKKTRHVCKLLSRDRQKAAWDYISKL